MKKLLLSTFIGLSLISCKNEKTQEGVTENQGSEKEMVAIDLELPEGADYAKIAGAVTNLEVPVDTVEIYSQNQELVKKIKMNADGTFSDTLKVQNGLYFVKIGEQYGRVFLNNGVAIGLRSNYPDFNKSLKFEGETKEADKSNFYAELGNLQSDAFDDADFDLSEEDFNKKIETLKGNFESIVADFKNLDEEFKESSKAQYEQVLQGMKMFYQHNKELANKFTGKPAPSFSGEDVNGKEYKLSDFKGKYVYIDVWATWCGPCKAEIPALKALEEEYRDKNIEFVSLSVDEPADKQTWKDFVKEKELKGVQIFDGNAWRSQFVQDMQIQGIPRFILVDPQGNIVDPSAPRPSSNVIKNKFKELGI